MKHDIEASDVHGKAVLVRVTKTYKPTMTKREVYDIARWAWWRMSISRASQCDYVFAVARDESGKGRIVGVFRPTKWGRVGKITPPKNNPNVKNDLAEGVRVAFEGAIADDATWAKYVGRSVSETFCNGRKHRMPYEYFNC